VLHLLIICHDDSFAPSVELIAAIQEWDLEMDRRGVRLDGRPLRPPADALTVRVRGGETAISQGPVTATAEQMAAYELLDCADLEEATRLASTHPMAAAGAIEIRPVWEELTDPISDSEVRRGPP
jgi:hypothetical protein